MQLPAHGAFACTLTEACFFCFACFVCTLLCCTISRRFRSALQQLSHSILILLLRLQLAIKRVSLRNPSADPQSKSHLRSPPAKAQHLVDHDASAQPLANICLFVNKYAAAVVHHKDGADFELASLNPGNTIITICRGVIVACARFMDWHGWQAPSEPAPLDVGVFVIVRVFVCMCECACVSSWPVHASWTGRV